MEKKYMTLALKEATKAYERDEVPIGAVIVKDGQILAKAHNQKETKQNVAEHAEMIAIRKASKKIKNWRLSDCEIYITLEPCPMCASAIHQARISKVYYGCTIGEKNNSEIIEKIFSTTNRNQKITHVENLNLDECHQIIQQFFKDKRK